MSRERDQALGLAELEDDGYYDFDERGMECDCGQCYDCLEAAIRYYHKL